MNNLFTFEVPGWKYYTTEEKLHDVPDDNGKWMYFFKPEDEKTVSEICKKAIEENIVDCVKRTKFYGDEKSGVCCFYNSLSDVTGHRKIIKFFMDNNMLQRSKSGKEYVEESFKTDKQTRNGEYGKQFKPILKLSDFIDLKTGEFIKTEKEKEEERMEATRYFENKYPDECKRIESALNRTISPEEIEKTMNMKNIKTIEESAERKIKYDRY